MTEKYLENFNVELKALLAKYDCSLNVGYNIQVVPNKKEEGITDITPE